MARTSLLTHAWFRDEDSTRLGVVVRMVACAILVVPGSSLLPGSRAITFCALLVASYLTERRWTHAAAWSGIGLLWRAWTASGRAPSYAITCGALGLLALGLAVARIVRARRNPYA